MSSTNGVSGVGTSALGQNQFLQLLTAQLQNQDPLNPVSSQDFVAQLATFSQLQETTSLNANFSELLKLQQLTQGSDLIGKTVTYTPTGSNATKTGVVNSVSVNNGKIALSVGSDSVTLDQVTKATS